MPRSQSSWHHHHPTGKTKRAAQATSQAKGQQNAASVVSSANKTNNGVDENKGTDKNKAALVGNSTSGESATIRADQAQTASTQDSTAQTAQTSDKTQTSESIVASPDSQITAQDQAQAQPLQSQEEESEVCCGLHEVCEKLATNSTKIEYFDDEELDVFAGRDPESYNDQEIDQFRDVMTTMYPSEVALWRQSLQLRGVALPVELEDEFMLILSEV